MGNCDHEAKGMARSGLESAPVRRKREHKTHGTPMSELLLGVMVDDPALRKTMQSIACVKRWTFMRWAEGKHRVPLDAVFAWLDSEQLDHDIKQRIARAVHPSLHVEPSDPTDHELDLNRDGRIDADDEVLCVAQITGSVADLATAAANASHRGGHSQMEAHRLSQAAGRLSTSLRVVGAIGERISNRRAARPVRRAVV